MSKSIILSLFACLVLTFQPKAQVAPVILTNAKLKLQYNPGQKLLEVTDRGSDKTFLRQGKLQEASGKAVVIAAHHPVFGEGKELRVNKVGGGYYSVCLYAGLPFVSLQETIVNTSSSIVNLQKQRSFSFLADLQKPVSQVKTLGTGGLLDPAANPGSYVFLTTVDPTTRNGIVAGWLTNEKGSGVLFSDTTQGSVQITGQIDYGRYHIPPGGIAALETLLVGYFPDARLGEEALADAMAKQYHIRLPERKAVYCTWYSEKNGGAGNSQSTRELAQFASEKLKDYGLGAIQLDDQWQDGEKLNGPARGFERAKPDGPYPNGMKEPADKIRATGLTAGIWWMPFARNHQAPEYKDRQHWFAHRLNGAPYETKWGGTSLDLTQPEVRQHISEVAAGMKQWGYRYFKMDGLWTGTVTEQVYINDGYKNDSMGNCLPLFDSTKTQIEAFRSGLQLLRSTVGHEVFLSGCCVSQNMRSFGASIGLVNAMRVGPDYNHDGQSIRTGAIRASRLYFLNGRVWWNDPDPSIIRESGASTADDACNGIGSLTRARLLPSWVAVTGQFFLSSDWLPDLPEERLDIMKKCMASHHGVARPVDAFDKTLPGIWVAKDQHTGTARNIIGLFNWDTTAQTIGSSLEWSGLNKTAIYYAFDFWENKPLPVLKQSFKYVLGAESCKVIAIRAASNHPVLVSTSAHITQGMTDVNKEVWSGNSLSGESKVIANDPYELRIAGLQDGGNWVPGRLTIKGASKDLQIVQVPDAEEGWLRVMIRSKQTGMVNWNVDFSKGQP